MLGRKRHLEHLKSVRLFSTLSNKDVTEIARAGEEVSYPAGHTLLVEGEEGDAAYIVLTGQVTVTRNGRTLSTLGPGEILGELALLDKSPRTASVVCDTDCTFLRLDRVHFIAVLEHVPNLAHKFLQTLAGRLRELDRKYYG